MGNQSLEWGGGNQHSWNLFKSFERPQLLYKEEFTSTSDSLQAKWKDNPSNRCSMLFPVHQTCPFYQSALEEKLMPWPSVVSSHPFWEAMHTASPHPYQILPSVATAHCLLMKDRIKSALHGANTLSLSNANTLLLVYSPDCKLKGEQRLRDSENPCNDCSNKIAVVSIRITRD